MSSKVGRRRAALVCVSLLAFGCGPLVMFPGGRLSGESKRAPRDWSFAQPIEVVQIETRPGDPYSVNVWGVSQGETFYVMAAGREQRWVQHLLADPRLRLKVCEDVYEMQAAEVDDAATVERVLQALVAKYDFRPSEAQRSEGVLFALTPR